MMNFFSHKYMFGKEQERNSSSEKGLPKASPVSGLAKPTRDTADFIIRKACKDFRLSHLSVRISTSVVSRVRWPPEEGYAFNL